MNVLEELTREIHKQLKDNMASNINGIDVIVDMNPSGNNDDRVLWVEFLGFGVNSVPARSATTFSGEINFNCFYRGNNAYNGKALVDALMTAIQYKQIACASNTLDTFGADALIISKDRQFEQWAVNMNYIIRSK